MILSYFQVDELIAARDAGRERATVSLDLGLTTDKVALSAAGVRFPDGQALTWAQLDEIRSSERGCFLVEDGEIEKVQFFSEASNLLYSLMPTDGAPTMLVSGIPMHRIKGIDPYHDTLRKVATIKPIGGRVLDTATGLGYTAIEAARTAERVVTVEIAPLALEVARCNPWSRALFDHPKITQVVGDVYDEIEAFEDASFDRVIHDPPAFSLAGDLYAGAFYRQLRRVLKPGGRLFHYIGDLESRSGRSVSRGVAQRLKEAGFRRVSRRPGAFGVVARS
jgi:uncharacterized protein